MKIYIRATTENHDVFKMTTDTSYYDNFLNPKDLEYMRKNKNRDGEIVMMTPDEYFEGASKIFEYRHNASELVDQRSDKYTDQYVEDMKNGDKFPLPYLNFADPGQEGLHRMLAAKRAFGADVKYPVLVVTVYDRAVEDDNKFWNDFYHFRNYELSKIIDDLETHLSYKYHVPPDNLIELSEDWIRSELDYHNERDETNYDVDFYCSVDKSTDGDERLEVYVTSFNGREFDEPELVSNGLWFDNMFDYEDVPEDNSDDIDIDDIDIDDIDDLDFISDMDAEEMLNYINEKYK